MRRLKGINCCTVQTRLIRQDVRSREVSYWNRAWEPFLTTRNPVVTYDPTEEGTTNTNLPPHLNINLSHFIKPTQQWLHLSVRGAFSHMGLTKWQSK